MPYQQLPAARSISYNDVLNGVLSSFPPGFPIHPGSNWFKVAEALADSDFRVIQFMALAQRELNPGSATITGALPSFEQAVVSEACRDVTGLNESQRQDIVVASIRGGSGGLTVAQIQTDLRTTFSNNGIVVEEFLPNRVSDNFTIGSRVQGEAFLFIRIPSYDPDNTANQPLYTRISCRLVEIVSTSTRWSLQTTE